MPSKGRSEKLVRGRAGTRSISKNFIGEAYRGGEWKRRGKDPTNLPGRKKCRKEKTRRGGRNDGRLAGETVRVGARELFLGTASRKKEERPQCKTSHRKKSCEVGEKAKEATDHPRICHDESSMGNVPKKKALLQKSKKKNRGKRKDSLLPICCGGAECSLLSHLAGRAA